MLQKEHRKQIQKRKNRLDIKKVSEYNDFVLFKSKIKVMTVSVAACLNISIYDDSIVGYAVFVRYTNMSACRKMGIRVVPRVNLVPFGMRFFCIRSEYFGSGSERYSY